MSNLFCFVYESCLLTKDKIRPGKAMAELFLKSITDN